MGQMVEFASNGGAVPGYLATHEAGAGPGIVVIQEWWGLVDHIKDVCDRFAVEGFTALAPDLYHGRKTTEPDEAGKLMMAMNMEEAARDLSGAVDYLLAHESVRGHQVGVVGFCMGGGLALWLATLRPALVAATVVFYGVIPWDAAQPDFMKLESAIQGHYAENDEFASPAAVAVLEKQLKDLDKEVTLHSYPNTQHAFFNDTRSEVYDDDAARQAWIRTLECFREKLG